MGERVRVRGFSGIEHTGDLLGAEMVPTNLRRWFEVHFVVDVLFAVPLFLFPDQSLSFFGWKTIDPLTSRLVGAALFGIGAGSFAGRNSGARAYTAMLKIKIIWSLSAIIGILITMISGGPFFGWVILLLFLIFFVVWVYYHFRVSKELSTLEDENPG
jgi:hypothetical protein